MDVRWSWRVPALFALSLTACGQSTRRDFDEDRGGRPATGGSAGAPAAGGASFAGAGAGAGASSSGAAGESGSSGAGGSGVSSGGFGGSGGAGGMAGAGASATAVDVSGRWAMFGFVDPVAVSLQQRGNALSGTGCCGGLPADDFAICCASLTSGSVVGQHVEFSFPVDIGPGVYAANAFVSSDGSRIAGPFHDLIDWGRPTAWVRIAPDQVWLPPTTGALSSVVDPRVGTFELALNDAEAVSGFSPGITYSLGLTKYAQRALIHGDLGAFWEGELSWIDAEETLLAGPVPESHPELPIELRLRFVGTLLREVTATFPSGEEGSFFPVPSM
jgi:hypothetical protein